MSCKKCCSSSQTKWILAGSVSMTLVLAISMILGLTLYQRTRPGRSSLLPVPIFSSLTSLSSTYVPNSILPSPEQKAVDFACSLNFSL